MGDITLTAEHFSEKDVSSFVCRRCLGGLNLTRTTDMVKLDIHDKLNEEMIASKSKIVYFCIVLEISFFL